MRRNKLNAITITPSGVTASPSPSISISLDRQFAEPDESDPSGEAVFSRDTLDGTITEPTIVALALQLTEAVAQHLADELKVPVKADPRRAAPLAMPKEVAAPAIVR